MDYTHLCTATNGHDGIRVSTITNFLLPAKGRRKKAGWLPPFMPCIPRDSSGEACPETTILTFRSGDSESNITSQSLKTFLLSLFFQPQILFSKYSTNFLPHIPHPLPKNAFLPSLSTRLVQSLRNPSRNPPAQSRILQLLLSSEGSLLHRHGIRNHLLERDMEILPLYLAIRGGS